MIDILQSIVAFIVALGVLITFHEFGHYWVARQFDVKILRFSIGFGRPLYKKTYGPDETEFIVAALPLGGYVKMLDEREGQVASEDLPRAFSQQTLSKRFAIVVAGPVFNFIFAIFAYWLIFIIGVNGLKPIIGEVAANSIAAQSGLVAEQEITHINSIPTATWSTVIDKLVNHTVHAELIEIDVINHYGNRRRIYLDLAQISIDDMAQGKLLDVLGLDIVRLKLPAIIGEVITGGVAERSGMKAMDKVIAVNGQSIQTWSEWVTIIRGNPNSELTVDVIRNSEMLTLSLLPDADIGEDAETVGRIGASVYMENDYFANYFVREAYAPIDAISRALTKTWDMSMLTLKVLAKMLVGEASVKNLSGPISIAQYAGQSADIGIVAFLSFMAIVSVSLGVLNLLPVPLLDGGHLLFYVIEFVLQRPLSESVQIWGQQIGLVLLLSLMSVAFYNDIIRLMG